ncbi:MAG TPA: cobalamin-binding protein [Gemmatimonadaceae bacterium]|nr:cobalamin-binding protein [Gemmatimonadaceae bacterium]
MRIVSFLPAGTEIISALGAGDMLVGRSHECDYPPEVQSLPVVSRPSLSLGGLSQEAIDSAVAAQLRSGESLYQVDEVLLRELAPDLVITQDLCQVCAPSGTELTRALKELPGAPEVLWLTPRSIAEVEQNITDVGRAIGRADVATAVIDAGRRRMAAVSNAVAGVPRRRVVFLEWTDPFFCAGHWVPEMIEIAGGHDPFGRPAMDSRRMAWEDIRADEPEVIIVAPCGFGLEDSIRLAKALPPCGDASVFAVDANAYFARPGPRVAEGIELLGHLFHPARCDWPHDHQPWEQVVPSV